MTITNTSIQRSIVLTEYIPVQLRAEKACDTAGFTGHDEKSQIVL